MKMRGTEMAYAWNGTKFLANCTMVLTQFNLGIIDFDAGQTV